MRIMLEGMRATVNMIDGRAILKVDRGFDMGIISRPLLKSLHRMHVLGATR